MVNKKQSLSMDKKNGRPSLNMSSCHYTRGGLNSNGVSPPQSPGGESQMSFNSTTPIYDPRRGTVTSIDSLPNSPSTFKFLPEEKHGSEMRTWESKKIRRLSACLVFFIVVAVVVSALFAWRELVSRQKPSNKPPHEVSTPTPTAACKFKATPIPMRSLSENIQKQLNALETWLKRQPTGALMANVVYMDKIIWNMNTGEMTPNSSPSASPTSQTPFPIASITKIITALMLFKLYDEKHISLDDKLKKYLPDLSITYPPDSHDIVLRELASQMAGFPREAPCYPQAKHNICPYNDSVMFERINKLQLVEKPGLHPVYSNLGFGLLGRVLAKCLNTTFETWVQENIFTPFGMKDSFFELTPKLTGKIPLGVHGEKPTEWGWLNPAAGAFISVQDLAKWEMKIFDTAENDSFLSSVITEEFLSPAFVQSDKFIVGTPWEMRLMDGYLWRFKNGYIYGYTSNMFLIPELKLGLNVFWTGGLHTGLSEHFQSLQAAFHEELSKRDPLEVNPPPGDSMPYVGVYKPGDIPTIDTVKIQEVNGRLNFLVVLPGGFGQFEFQLNYLKKNTFEVIDRKRACSSIFMIGINHDRVHFNPSSVVGRQFNEFFVFGMHPRGKATYTRVTS